MMKRTIKGTARSTASIAPLLLTILALGLSAHAATTTVTIRVAGAQPGATVTLIGLIGIDQSADENGRCEFKDFKFEDKYAHSLKVVKNGFATTEKPIPYGDVKSAKSERSFGPKIVLVFLEEMPLLSREVTVLITNAVAGATVSVDGKQAGMVPLTNLLTFARSNVTTPWNSIRIKLEKAPEFREEIVTLRYEDLFKPGTTAPALYAVPCPPLMEVQRSYQLEVISSEPDAIIDLNEKEIGRTGAKTNAFRTPLLFSSTNGLTWTTNVLKVHKKDWEFREPGKLLGKPAFVQSLTVGGVAAGTNAGKGAFVVNVTLAIPTHFATPIRYFEPVSHRLEMVEINAVSQSDNKDGGQSAPGEFAISKLGKEILILSRMSFLPDPPDGKDHILITVPKWDVPSSIGGSNAKPQLVSASIYKVAEQTKAPIRTDNSHDTDPFATKDWLYYSSNRSTTNRHIWRVSLKGQVGVARSTQDDNLIHIEPAVSPDGQTLAYSARPANAPGNVPFSIWLADEDGRNHREIRDGRSPAWSHDGKRLAFVHQNKISIMKADGSDATEITKDTDARVLYPVWAPDDRYIYYCADMAKDKAGNRQFDIWRTHTEKAGEPEQVTTNDSLDYAPLIVGRRLYFFSNRGAPGEGIESLKVRYMDLPPD